MLKDNQRLRIRAENYDPLALWNHTEFYLDEWVNGQRFTAFVTMNSLRFVQDIMRTPVDPPHLIFMLLTDLQNQISRAIWNKYNTEEQ